MAQRDNSDFRSWIGLKSKINVADLPAWMGGMAGAVLMLVGFGLFLLVGATLIKLLYAVLSQGLNANPTSEDIRNLGLAAGAMIGIPFLIWRSVVAQKQVDVSEQGHITDRINKAVEGLGAEKTVKRDGVDQTEPNLEVRIGALYALERISQDSARDHIQVMEILCAYIRNNADRHSPKLPAKEPKQGWASWGASNRVPLPVDVDTALTIIKRRSSALRQLEALKNYKPSFRRASFHALELIGWDFTDADFSMAQLQGSDLNFSKLNRAILWRTDLSGCSLIDTNLELTNLAYSKFRGSICYGTIFKWAYISNVDFDDCTELDKSHFLCAALIETDFSNCDITTEKVRVAFGDTTVTLPGNVGPNDPDWPPHWASTELTRNQFQESWSAWLAKIGFQPPKNP